MSSHEIITRKEAIERGLKRCFTGKPCKHGHVSERMVSNGVCLVCLKIVTMTCRKEKPEVIRANRKRWKEAHPEKVIEMRRIRFERDKENKTFLEQERNRDRERRAYERAIKRAEQDQETE